MRALVIGHFSTVGDIESLDFVESVLKNEGIPRDLLPFNPKFAPHLRGALRTADLEPAKYSHLIAVCGPLWPGLLAERGIALHRFAHCTRIGVNLTMVRPLDEWNPFHLLLERDSDRLTRPDITFMRETARTPVAGLCTIARQREYGGRQRHGESIGLLGKLIEARSLAAIDVDTRWPRHRNSGGLASPDQVMAVIAKLDVLLTNRLHGLVYALRAGVPVIALDPVLGGDKVVAQAEVLGWPAVSRVEDASAQWIERTLDWCLSDDGRSAAQSIAAAARAKLQPAAIELRAALLETFDYRPLPPPVSLFGRLAKALRGKRGG